MIGESSTSTVRYTIAGWVCMETNASALVARREDANLCLVSYMSEVMTATSCSQHCHRHHVATERHAQSDEQRGVLQALRKL